MVDILIVISMLLLVREMLGIVMVLCGWFLLIYIIVVVEGCSVMFFW